MNLNDTIGAIATGNGGSISIIRVSGEKSIQICSEIFHPQNYKKKILLENSHTIHYGSIYYNNNLLDQVLISIFKKPKSFTGENIVEISCHASLYIQEKILEILQKKGMRIAEPGEFTFRAFMNKKLDLIQAESIVDIISSESEIMHKIAINQIKGNFSNELNKLRELFINFSSLIELELDFSEENIELLNRKDLKKILTKIQNRIKNLLNSYELGNVIKNGIPVVIIGKPNAGKSTLMNALLNENRVIVSNIPGTTRDSIEEVITLKGIDFRFIDTAGIHKSNNIIELIGIKKTYKKAKIASFIIYLYDFTISKYEHILEDLNLLNNKNAHLILCKNKIDLKNVLFPKIDFNLNFKSVNLCEISAQNKKHLNILKSILTNTVLKTKELNSNIIITNARHLELLKKIDKSINKILLKLINENSLELLAYELKYILKYIGQITGHVIDNDKDILQNIFKKFCIGK